MSLAGMARAHGAVTVVNAIPTGTGAAFGITLATEARVEIDRVAGPVQVTIEGAEDEDPGLAQACLAALADRLDTPLSGHVHTTSQLPIARGLKSSSVAANAIALACLDAIGQELADEDVLAISVAAARRAGVTVTGALDDAAASLLGGLVVTDNRAGRIVERKPIQTDLVVLLLVPERRRYTSAVDEALAPMTHLSQRCLSVLGEDGDAWPRALTLNGLGVAACLGEGLDPAYRALGAGALAAGTTGTGPAVAAICEPEAVRSVRNAWERYDADVLHAHPRNREVAA